MLRLVVSGLKFCKQRLNYGCHNSFSTSKFKMAEKKAPQYIKQPLEVVFRSFYLFTITKFPIAKNHLTRDIMCQTRNLYVTSRIFLLKKGHMTQKTTVVI